MSCVTHTRDITHKHNHKYENIPSILDQCCGDFHNCRGAIKRHSAPVCMSLYFDCEVGMRKREFKVSSAFVCACVHLCVFVNDFIANATQFKPCSETTRLFSPTNINDLFASRCSRCGCPRPPLPATLTIADAHL